MITMIMFIYIFCLAIEVGMVVVSDLTLKNAGAPWTCHTDIVARFAVTAR